ncbi:site-2 protease family protein [Methanobrevibacter sp. DSM 116169]|uniref:site-2 protease family protein n=1 Tax=Methanobrevibacter sp. DSM 116169 TaxID=3242727 RepID=UPI0038FD1E93
MFKFTSNELRDLFISFLVISFGFAFIFSGRNFSTVWYLLPIAMIGVGSGFILHEIAHKITSMHYGYWAEYKLWPTGLLIALVTAFMGFLFAAPGAVYFYGNHVTKKENGIVSLAGPVTNILIALVFLFLAILMRPFLNPADGIIMIIFQTFIIGFTINSYLALFNMIPFAGLDGSKVIRWNPLIWIVVVIISGAMTYLGWTNQLIPFILGF